MTEWLTPPKTFEISPSQVDVWRVRLDSMPPHEAAALSRDERQRAANFHFDKDRIRYTVSHVRLRGILARYLRCEPRDLLFSLNEYGKPFLPGRNIEFNLSHSGGFALIAVARGRNVGVDVEQIRADVDIENLASRHFSHREVSELMTLPLEQRLAGVFHCWTRKEAYIKAQGLGLSLALDSFDVSLGEPASLRATRPDAGEAAQWTMRSLDVATDYAGAVAVMGSGLDFKFWDYAS
jgi:4'-phosphopantetheinyl transferase